MRILQLVIATLVLSFANAAHAKRVALVVGNDAYEEVTPLRKAVNDARSMEAALRTAGFKVLRAENVSRREMNKQLQAFANRLSSGDEAVFYYAGHGIEIDGRNFLLPVDIPKAAPGQDDFVKSESVAVDSVIARIASRGARVSILILDACRDNPFPAEGTRSLGGTRGLSRVTPPKGTFVMYSAGANQSALDRLSDDDTNPNSVYTRALLPLIAEPGLSLVDAAKRVRRDVERMAGSISHDQRPAYYDEVSGDFFFTTGNPPIIPETQVSSLGDGAPARQPGPSASADETFWNSVDQSSADELRAYLEVFPQGQFAPLARIKLDRLEDVTQEDRPVADPTMISIQEAIDFVNLTNARSTAQNLPDFVNRHFASFVDYYDRGVLPRSAVLADKQKWFDRWGDWRISLHPESIELWRRPDGTYDLAYAFDYAWSGRLGTSDQGKILSGSARSIRVVRKVDGIIVVVSEKGEEISADEPPPVAQAPAQTRGNTTTTNALALAYVDGLNPNGDNWLALRSDAGTHGRLLAKMAPNILLRILDEAAPWYRVSVESGPNAGITGWSHGRYVTCCKLTLGGEGALVNPSSVWDHNGSRMMLFAPGDERFFVYADPREGIRRAGVLPGEILFHGTSRNGAYAGTAYVFSAACGKQPYAVSGPIRDGGVLVSMSGSAPDAGNDCRIAGYRNDNLLFSYLSRSN